MTAVPFEGRGQAADDEMRGRCDMAGRAAGKDIVIVGAGSGMGRASARGLIDGGTVLA